MKKLLRHVLTVLCCLLSLAGMVYAQEVQVSIQAQPSTVTANQQFRLTVTIAGSANNMPDPRIQGLEPFRIVGSSQSSQISIVNGRINSTKSIHYTMLAGEAGTYEIGPAMIPLDDKTYSSNTVKVTVNPSTGGAPPATGQSAQPPSSNARPPAQSSRTSSGDGGVFIRGRADKQEVYLGEQLTYTFGFYSRVRMSENPEYTEPKFEGFWKEDIDREAVVSNQTVNGALYRVQELRYALFPTVGGKAEITPANLVFSVRNVWDFFDRGRRVALNTDTVKITVKPLPTAGRPDNFSGAVGNFQVTASLDKEQVPVGDALTLSVQVRGTGNVRIIEEPPLIGLEDFDIYESSSDVSVGFSGTTVRGTKTFKYVIVPRKAGQYEWEGLELSFFDPADGKYKNASTGPISFSISESEKQESVTYRTGGESVVAVGQDINYIKEDASALRSSPTPLNQRAWFWLLHLLPLAGIGLALLYRRHKGRLMSDRGYARYRVSDKQASSAIKRAEKAADNADYTSAYSELNRALTNYISDRLNVEAAGMTADELDQLLEQRAVDEEVRQDLHEVLDRFSFVRFASGEVGDLSTFKEYRTRVKKLLNRLAAKL